MFIRLKPRKNASNKQYSYAYLVKNNWKNSSSRQSIKKYLGRVFTFEKINFKDNIKKKNTLRGTLKELVKNELKNRGFKQNNHIFYNNKVEVNISELTVKKSTFPAVIEMNQGFMCDYTLNRLFTYRLRGSDPLIVGKRFAERIVEVGIKIPQEIFVETFNKFYGKSLKITRTYDLSMEFKQQILKQLKPFVKDAEKLLEVPPSQELGDYALPCFTLAKEAKKAPNAIAKEIASKLKPDDNIAKIQSTGPYVNFFVNKTKLASEVLSSIAREGANYGSSAVLSRKSIMIEYSSPNTNKAQHLGHVRNNLLGMALSNTLAFAGAKVIKVRLMNDRGLGVSQANLAYMKWGKDKNPDIKPDHFVANFYVMFQKKAKENPELQEEAKKLLKKWELGDKDVIKVWKKMNGWVYEGYDETYRELGCEFDVTYYESKIYTEGRDIIQKAFVEGKFVKKEGAVMADLSKFKLPDKVLLKSDGTSLYITQDIYLAKKKFEDYKIDASYYLVNSEQNLYFKQLFAVLQILGVKWAKNCHHLSYGYVSLPSGRMKSREGTVVDADDVISEMKKLALKEVKKRHDVTKEEAEKRASEIALGAIKFFFLKYDPAADFVFNPEESIAFEGETGPYVQYAHARACSILKKAETSEFKDVDFSKIAEKSEQELVLLFWKFSSVIEDAAQHNKPSLICRYLIDVAQKFSEFYHQCPCIVDDKELMKARLLLVKSTKQVISNGLELMGIEAPSAM